MSRVGAHVRPLALLTCVAIGASSFRPGEVCEDINPHDFLYSSTGKTLSRALAGKHLRIIELVWAPFAKRDPSVEGNAGWSGVDMELFELISNRLNFTYELHEMIRLSNETWTETLFRHLMQGDLIGCYWLNTRYRRDRTYMLNGHIDSSIVMSVPPPKVEEPTFAEKFWTFLKPFTPSAWLGILTLCFISGLGYYLLEGLSQGHRYPFESIYEAIGVMIFGENPPAHNPTARLHAPMWGFVCMVVLSIYTANMASFMTLRARPVQRIHNVHDLVAHNAPACIYKDEPLGEIIYSTYPDIKNWRQMDSYLDAGLALMAEGGEQQCDALTVPRIELKSLETDDRMCGMRSFGEPLVPNEAGWVTSFASSCVGQAIETELQDLYVAGKVDEIMSKYRVAAECPALSDRQDNTDNSLDLEDVAGLFIVYLVFLVSLILYRIMFGRCAAKTRLVQKVEKAEEDEGVVLAHRLRHCCFGEHPTDKEEVTLDAIMNRLDEMHKEIRDLQSHVQAQTNTAALTLDQAATESCI